MKGWMKNDEGWMKNDERRTNKQTFVTVESILQLKILPCALVPTMRCCSQHCRIGNSIYTVTYFKFCNFCQHKKFVLSLTLNNSVTSLLNVKIKDIFRILIMSRFWYHSWYQIKLDDSKIEVFSLTPFDKVWLWYDKSWAQCRIFVELGIKSHFEKFGHIVTFLKS